MMNIKKYIFKFIFAFSLSYLSGVQAHASTSWLNSISWTETGAYKECSGIIFNRCWHDVNVYTNVNSARKGDLVIVYSKKSNKEIARFTVKGINYEASSKRCWITAKSGRKPDTYVTALGCY